jgi:predicted transcriptional regulator
MVKLGKRQEKVLNLIIASDKTTIKDISNTTGIDQDIVRNIVKEFHQADIISVTVDNLISYRTERLSTKAADEKNEWEPYKPVLKNLSRIV